MGVVTDSGAKQVLSALVESWFTQSHVLVSLISQHFDNLHVRKQDVPIGINYPLKVSCPAFSILEVNGVL